MTLFLVTFPLTKTYFISKKKITSDGEFHYPDIAVWVEFHSVPQMVPLTVISNFQLVAFDNSVVRVVDDGFYVNRVHHQSI